MRTRNITVLCASILIVWLGVNVDLSHAKLSEIETKCDMFDCYTILETDFEMDSELTAKSYDVNIAEKKALNPSLKAEFNIPKETQGIKDMKIELMDKNTIKVSGTIKAGSKNLWGLSIFGDDSFMNSTWWNFTWWYYTNISFTETDGYDRDWEEVDINFAGADGHASTCEETRVISPNGIEIDRDIIINNISGSNYNCTLRFQVNVSAMSEEIYSIYYGNDTPVGDGGYLTTYISNSTDDTTWTDSTGDTHIIELETPFDINNGDRINGYLSWTIGGVEQIYGVDNNWFGGMLLGETRDAGGQVDIVFEDLRACIEDKSTYEIRCWYDDSIEERIYAKFSANNPYVNWFTNNSKSWHGTTEKAVGNTWLSILDTWIGQNSTGQFTGSALMPEQSHEDIELYWFGSNTTDGTSIGSAIVSDNDGAYYIWEDGLTKLMIMYTGDLIGVDLDIFFFVINTTDIDEVANEMAEILPEFEMTIAPQEEQSQTTTTTTTVTTTVGTTTIAIDEFIEYSCLDNTMLMRNWTYWNGTEYISVYNATTCEYNCSETLLGTRCDFNPAVNLAWGFLILVLLLFTVFWLRKVALK